MCIEFLTCWCLCNQEQTCCIFFQHVDSIKYIQLADWVELVASITALVLFLNYADTLILHFVVVLFGNFLPLSIRLIGSYIRWCGLFKLWTRKAFFNTRLLALVCQVVVLAAQVCLTVLVFKNKITFAYSGADDVVDDNYAKLSYGLCVFCSPDDC